VTLSATDAGAAETGSDPGTFRFTRTGSTVGALTVNYTVAAGVGQASAADYAPALTGVATIPSGSSFVDVTVTPVDDLEFEGSETVTLTVFDTGTYDVGDSATATVVIADNDPSDTAINSSPTSPTTSTSAFFLFSGSQPVSALAGFECSLDGAAFSPCSSPVTLTNLAEGRHTFAVRAVARSGAKDPTPASFTWIIDRTAPTITLAASVVRLWPPNGGLVPDTFSGAVQDALSGVDPESVIFHVVDEYGEVQPMGPVALGAGGTFAFTVPLEARRLGTDRDGRTYQVIVSAKDGAGNQATASIAVVVPHDQGN
jgi:hypothetical protein